MAEVLKMTQPEVTPGSDWSRERKLLWELIYGEDGGTKIIDIAKALGKSHSMISLYARNKYPGNERFESLVREYLIKIGRWEGQPADSADVEDIAEEEADPVSYKVDMSQISLVETDDYRRVRGICRMCALNKEFGIIAGDPGSGKTYALERFKADPGFRTVIITIDETSTKKSILVDLAEELGLDMKGTPPTLLRKIVKELKSRPRLVVFDEADLIKKVSVLETIRAIYDKARNVGMVLCGNQNLAERLIVMAEERPELARIRDRIGFFRKMNGLTSEEATRFLEGVNLSGGARELLINVGRRRGVRQLVKAMARLLEVTQGERITEDLVEDLGQIYLGFNA